MTPRIREFNVKVQQMNTQGHKQLCLSAAEARQLHSEIFDLLNNTVQLQRLLAQLSSQPDRDGGTF